MPTEKNLTLLTWMATNRDPLFLDNSIYALNKEAHGQVKKVYYLYNGSLKHQENIQKVLQEAKRYARQNNIALEPIHIDLNNISDHSEIIQKVTAALAPRLNEMGEVCVNISSGTPAMTVVWMFLHAKNFFRGNATFYDVQKYAPELKVNSPTIPREQQKIEKIDIDLEDTYERAMENFQQTDFDACGYGHKHHSEARKKAMAEIKKYSKLFDVPFLILGERGIGKSTIVNATIGKIKKRRIVSETCGSWDNNLAESALFGHAKGAFTGANQERKGLIEEAEGGILFLDEIQDLPKRVQRLLLDTLQKCKRPQNAIGDKSGTSPKTCHRYKRVGEDFYRYADVEFVFASNNSLEQLNEKLDPDFFDRISFFITELPSLANCKEDLEDDWKAVWHIACEQLNVGTTAPDAPWNLDIQEFFSQKENLQGNFRSLQMFAYHIIANEAWGNIQKIREIIGDLHKRNAATAGDFSAIVAGAPSESVSGPLPAADSAQEFDIENFSEFQTCGWKNAEKMFKEKLARWAVDKYGSLSKAAKQLSCNQDTLRKILNQ